MPHLLIGTSGWVYKHWNRVFYPAALPAGERLPFYGERFSTVEINYSFYRLPNREAFAGWRARSPEGFTFAAKASRYLTHVKRLRDPEEPLERLMNSATGLEEKLGPILFQFPASWPLHLDRLEGLLAALQTYPDQRFACEFRHPTWLVDPVYERLAEAGVAICLPVGWGLPVASRLTANWTYIRFHHGATSLSFHDEELQTWAGRIRSFLNQGADVYAYFNNDPVSSELGGLPAATENAGRLREMLGEAPRP